MNTCISWEHLPADTNWRVLHEIKRILIESYSIYIYIYMNVGYHLLPAKDVYNLGGPLSIFRFHQVSASLYMYWGGTVSVSGFIVYIYIYI